MSKKQYTVTDVPLWCRPLHLLLSVLVAFTVYSIFVLFHFLCRIEYRGKGQLISSPNHIYSMWHENLIPYFIVHIRYKRKYTWLNHPAWFMKPIHMILFMMGTKKLALGSSGNSGRKALNEIIDDLKDGKNTVINPDGPSGPVKELKEGVLEMALVTGVPVVPLKIITPVAWVWKFTWDHKRIPVPFSKVIVEYGTPVKVTEENYEKAKQEIVSQM